MFERRNIPLLEPHLVGNAGRYLQECVDTNFVSSVGPFVERFERLFAERVGSKFAVPCSSGTAALHVALHALDVDVRDEVFVSDLTFIASANPILYERATPVLVDAERATWNLDPQLIVEELERRARSGDKQPRAIIAVHILGHPAKIDLLVAACEKHGVVLIEDAAEALGARYSATKREVGSIGRVGVFSFNGNKVITTGGGGMLVTDDEKLATRARHLTTQARLPGLEYRHDEFGFNYRLTNIAAAVGVAQLEQLDQFLARKHAIAKRYDEAFSGVEGITRPPRQAWAEPSDWLYTVLLRQDIFGTRENVTRRLTAAGIQVRPIWTPLHMMPPYAKCLRLGKGTAESLFADAISLPCSVQLSAEDHEHVVRSVLELRS